MHAAKAKNTPAQLHTHMQNLCTCIKGWRRFVFCLPSLSPNFSYGLGKVHLFNICKSVDEASDSKKTCSVNFLKNKINQRLISSWFYLCHMHAARNWADAVGGTDWRGWPGPLLAAWLKQEAQTRGRTGRLREPQACQHSMADL